MEFIVSDLLERGTYILYDVHPFQRPWADDFEGRTPEKPCEEGGLSASPVPPMARPVTSR